MKCSRGSTALSFDMAIGAGDSEDLRAKVLAAVDRGQGVYPVAALFGVSVSYINKALPRRRVSGIPTALPARGQPGRKLESHFGALRGQVAAHPDDISQTQPSGAPLSAASARASLSARIG